MTNLPKSVEIHLGRQGRLVIPVALRQLLGFEEGDTLIARGQSGRLWQQSRQIGLSLGGRACLSLGLRLGLPVLTCDRTWATLSLGLNVQVIR